MAINKITGPGATPSSISDWAGAVDWLNSILPNINIGTKIYNGYVKNGSLFNIGGSLYLADSDTAITGTESDYVMITPSGSTASASYASSLSGVTWDDANKGYYDASDNLYIFDEYKAIINGYFTIPHFPLNQESFLDIYSIVNDLMINKKLIANQYNNGAIMYDGLTAGDSILSSHTDSLPIPNTTYFKLISFLSPYGGTLRIVFTLNGSTLSSGTVYSRIYKNGVAIGTERILNVTSINEQATYSEDINFSIGDTIEIWGKKTTGVISGWVNFIYIKCYSTELYGAWS